MQCRIYQCYKYGYKYCHCVAQLNGMDKEMKRDGKTCREMQRQRERDEDMERQRDEKKRR